MRALLLLTFIGFFNFSYAQLDQRISTMDFVQVLNDNAAEADYYYQNNWKLHREKALKREYIHSYEVLVTDYSPETPYHRVLITTYPNKELFDLREANFGKLIKEKGGLSLLNDKQPSDFRSIIFNNEMVRHWLSEQ